MKKLLLLSALLIFACSSDDSTSDNNNDPSAKKLLSISRVNQACGVYYNSNFSYQNERLASATYQYVFEPCDGGNTEFGNQYTDQYEHFSDRIIENSEEYGVTEFLINDDGTLIDESIVFNNGYLTSAANILYVWNEGYLTSINYNDNPDTVITDNTYFEYSDYDNLLGVLPNWYLYPGEGSAYDILGLYGKGSNKLPSIIETEYVTDDEIDLDRYEFSYVFDDDGYVIYFDIINTNTYQGETNVYTGSVELTYAD